MQVATERTVTTVSIDRTDGAQTTLERMDRVYDRHGRRIGLDQIAAALNDPTGWIDFETDARYEEGEREEWQGEPTRYTARARIYARAVVEVMAVYDEEAA